MPRHLQVISKIKEDIKEDKEWFIKEFAPYVEWYIDVEYTIV